MVQVLLAPDIAALYRNATLPGSVSAGSISVFQKRLVNVQDITYRREELTSS